MKTLYWLAAMTIVITMGSCSNDQELDTTQTKNNGKEIGFRSFIDKGNATRATVTTGSNILGFTVTGWWDRKGTSTTAGDITKAETNGDEYIFNAFEINRRETGIDDWSYSPMRYWPSEEIIGGGVTFFAYSPASSQNVKVGLHNYTGDKIEYTVPNPKTQTEIRVTPQEDFLLAKTGPKDENDKVITDGTVALNFVHALSRAKFFARTTKPNLTYVIGGIEMIGLSMTGKIAFDDVVDALDTNGAFEYPAADKDPLTIWGEHADKGKLVLDMGDSPINLLNEFSSLHGESGALMVLPQVTNLAEDPTKWGKTDDEDPTPDDDHTEFLIKVRYKAYLNNPTGTYYAGGDNWYENAYFLVIDEARSTKDKTVPFAFEIGRQYNFYFTFGSEVGEEITFNVGVANWDDTHNSIHIPQIDDYKSVLSDDIIKAMGNPTKISVGDVLAKTTLTIGDGTTDVTQESLKGLEYFENLKTLIFYKTDGNVSLDLTGFKKLEKVSFGVEANLAKIDISNIVRPVMFDINPAYGATNHYTVTVGELIVWNDFKTATEGEWETDKVAKLMLNTFSGIGKDTGITIDKLTPATGTLGMTQTKLSLGHGVQIGSDISNEQYYK
ncbi:fimbrillin family protein [Alistipes sp. OttesenSCG-928-B03]|nr:fimbrillin family protein [Alistipes sp. OttesenSCG-928-B03]